LAKLCVVLDTQLLLRGATARRASLSRKVYHAWVRGEYELLLSQEILTEILRVLADAEVRRKLRITDEILLGTAALLMARGSLRLYFASDSQSMSGRVSGFFRRGSSSSSSSRSRRDRCRPALSSRDWLMMSSSRISSKALRPAASV